MIIPNIVVDVPVSLVQLIVIVFIVVPSLCVLATLSANRVETWHYRRWVKEQDARIAKENEALNERRANLQHERNDLRIQKHALAEAKREFHEGAEKLKAEGEDFDTFVSVLDMDEIPRPNDMADTVEFEVPPWPQSEGER